MPCFLQPHRARVGCGGGGRQSSGKEVRRGLAVGLQKEKTQKLAVHAGGCGHNGGEKTLKSIHLLHVCVFITAVPFGETLK